MTEDKTKIKDTIEEKVSIESIDKISSKKETVDDKENVEKKLLNSEQENKSSESISGTVKKFRGKQKNSFRKPRFNRKREKPEFEQKIINISRVTRVVKGGRRLSFRVDMVIGDRKGKVGIGTGKATDTTIAIEKAFNKAKKNLIKVERTKDNSIPYSTRAKQCASIVRIMPNNGRGLVSGSTARNVLELAGITNVTSKVLTKSKNQLNNAFATFKAIAPFSKKVELTSKKINTDLDKKGNIKKFKISRNFNR